MARNARCLLLAACLGLALLVTMPGRGTLAQGEVETEAQAQAQASASTSGPSSTPAPSPSPAPVPTPAQSGCGGEGQKCCGEANVSPLSCNGDLFCDAPQCDIGTSKCWRLPAYPSKCGVLGKPCCPLFKCADYARWPKDYPAGGRYDGFACKQDGVTCDYGSDSSKGWTTTSCTQAK